MSQKNLVLVTGVNGFIASNIALQLMKSGYSVRGTVRSGKAEALRKSLGTHYPSLELVTMDDISGGDFSDILKGIGAIIHVASPIPTADVSPKEILDSVIDASTNILRQALKANISKVVVTSSFAATMDTDMKQAFEGRAISEKDWGNADYDHIIKGDGNPMSIYLSCKILGEKEVWRFADWNQGLDLAAVLPPFVYGPFVPHFPVPSQGSLSSNGHVYNLLLGKTSPIPVSSFCDVRDVARAHVLALDTPPATESQAKRFLVCGGEFTWKAAVEHLMKVRPELMARLPSLDSITLPPGNMSTIDATRAKEKLNLSEYVDWKTTIEDTIDDLLRLEAEWKA